LVPSPSPAPTARSQCPAFPSRTGQGGAP
jgi:hypothetical protein